MPEGKDVKQRRKIFLETQLRKQRLQEKLKKIKYKLAVLSGKGGVGKSTVAVNLAVALAEEGFSVGLLDADLHGPNVVRILGIEDRLKVDENEQIIPVTYGANLKVVSLALLLEDGVPVVWRGPLKITAIEQLIADVDWEELDFLIIDLPPGTGDEALTIYQNVDVNGTVFVTTPQNVAVDDVKRAIKFVEEVIKVSKGKHRFFGLVENMSYLRCPCGDVVYPFGKGGAERLAEEYGLTLLVKVPLDPKAMELMDEGKPPVVFHRGSEFEDAFRRLASAVVQGLNAE